MATLAIGAAVYLPPTDRSYDAGNDMKAAAQQAQQAQQAAMNDALAQVHSNTAALESLVPLSNAVTNLRSSIGNNLLTLLGGGRSTPLTPTQRLPLMAQVDQAKAQANDLLNQVTLNNPAAKLALTNLAKVRLEQLGLTASLNTNTAKDKGPGPGAPIGAQTSALEAFRIKQQLAVQALLHPNRALDSITVSVDFRAAASNSLSVQMKILQRSD